MGNSDNTSKSTPKTASNSASDLAANEHSIAPESLWALTAGLLEGCLVLGEENRVRYINQQGVDYLQSIGRAPHIEGYDPGDVGVDSGWARLDEFLPESWILQVEKMSQLSRSDLPGLISHRPVLGSAGIVDWRLRYVSDGRIRYLFFRPSQERHNESHRVQELEAELADLRGTMELSQELLRSSNEKLNESVEKQQEMYAQLVDSTRLKTEFLANTSHELRTPLNAIIGFLQMIMDELYEDDEERDRFTKNAFSSAEHLLTLINDVLDMAKIESGSLTMAIQPVDAEDLFDGIEDMFGMHVAERGLKLDFTVDPSSAGSVMADPSRLRQILINLIGNAIKFTDEGEVSVSLAPYPDDAETMVFSVEDTGVGIAPTDQAKIFEKFAQVDGSSTRQVGGTGLGLAISKTLVEMMGGEIWLVQSGKGKGTTISFSLPSAACNAANGPKPEANAQTSEDEVLPLDF